MTGESFTYSKWLWIKVVAALFGMAYCAELAVRAWASHVDVEMLGPEEYSSDIEVVVLSLLAAWFLNYVLVCLQRQNDFVATDGRFLEIDIHRNMFFPFSRRHVRIDMGQVQKCKVVRQHFLIFFPYGVRLKLKVADKCQTFVLVGLKMTDKELVRMIHGCGVTEIRQDYVREGIWMPTIVLCLLTIVVAVAVVSAEETFMPSFIWIPVCAWGVLMSVYFRDKYFIGLSSSFLMGIFLGATTYLAVLSVNYHFADWDEPDVRVEHTIINSWSKYHQGSGAGRHRRLSHTDYYVSFTTIGRNPEIMVLKISNHQFLKVRNLFRMAKKTSTIILPMHRGGLGYPVFDRNQLVFRSKIETRSRYHSDVESRGRGIRFLKYN